jgi:5-formaminoimidazole-4-carboxamide-1-(beta)-D-ribofuranosyl 5'-monophosphate synthetase
MKGAKDEGFKTLVLSLRRRSHIYRRYPFIDEVVEVDQFLELVSPEVQALLEERGALLIPHGTLISEVGVDLVEKELRIQVFGNRHLLRWEADRGLKERLMRVAGLRLPKAYASPEEIDRLVIVKLPGAAGGRGYFLANSPEDYHRQVARLTEQGLLEPGQALYIQEYVLGVPVYLQYFYSPLKERLELLGADRRYETDVDAWGRIPAWAQPGDKGPTYLVVGNQPLVLRESLLDEVFRMGEAFVEACRRLVPPGMIGPFCIEGVYQPDGRFTAFEFSARIVAGTNLYMEGSPYSALLYPEGMSMGRRIAREVREGLKAGRLGELTT